VVEAMTLTLGFHRVIKVGYKYIQVKGHSKIIINATSGKIYAPWQVDFLSNILRCSKKQSEVLLFIFFTKGMLLSIW